MTDAAPPKKARVEHCWSSLQSRILTGGGQAETLYTACRGGIDAAWESTPGLPVLAHRYDDALEPTTKRELCLEFDARHSTPQPVLS